MARRYCSSRKPAQALADRIITKCQAKNRLFDLELQIKSQEALLRQAEIAIMKYKKEMRLIEKMDSLPKTKRGINVAESTNASKEAKDAKVQDTAE